MSILEELATAGGRVAEAVGPAVVSVGGRRSGSGFVIDAGHVLTNAHNVGPEGASVTFADGRRADGRLAGVDVDGDLAVLAVETADIRPIEWAADLPGLGAAVFAVTPTAVGPRLTIGFVSSIAQAFRGPRGRPIAGGLEHTAPLARGSSGSPLTDAAGRVVGINTNRLGGGFYVALPADGDLRRRAEALAGGTNVERPRLGVGIAPAAVARRLRRAVGLPERDGVLVREVEEGSPADAGGVRMGDLLVEANGAALADADDLYGALAAAAKDQPFKLHAVRGAEELELTIRFAGATG